MFTSSSPFTLVAARARRTLDRLEENLRLGQVSTRADLLALVIGQLKRFADTLAAPSLEIPRMGKDELLIRQSLTRPLDQAVDDVELAHEQLLTTREQIRQIFNVCQAEREGLGARLAEVQALVDQFRLWVSDSDPSLQWSGDTFNDLSKVDPASTVFVDTRAGVVTLQPVSSVSLSDRVVAVTIDRELSAGGLPGNNLEIRAPGQEAFTGEAAEPRPLLYSDSLPRKDHLPSILDGDPDTWFEWERVYVPSPQPTVLAGRAHVTDPAGKPFPGIPTLANWNCFIRWPGPDQRLDTGTGRKGYPLAYFKPADRKDLRLGLTLTLDQPRQISWMQLTPFLRGSAYPEVEQILVSQDGERWRALLDVPTVLNPRINRGVDFSGAGLAASNFEGVGVWPFPSTLIRYVKVILKQSTVYETPLGIAHRFYNTTKEKKKKVLGLTLGKEMVIRRTVGPTLTVGSYGHRLADSAEIESLLSETQTQVATTQQFDIFRGERQVIGIRDLTLEQRSYQESGQFVARPVVLSRPARAVALLTTEQIPAGWPPTAPDGRPWIAYEISADGQGWQSIVPQVAALEDSIAHFNPPAEKLYLRATLSRPEDDPTSSPAVLAYALKVLG